MKILEKTLNEMDSVFTSNQFAKQARLNGLSQIDVLNGAMSSFLHQNAKQLDSKRIWSKVENTHSNDALYDENVTASIPDEEKDAYKITEAIQFLKKEGYKIQKKTLQWVDL